MGESHVEQVADVDVLVEGLFDEILRLVAGQVGDASVQEDEPKIQRRPEHEHVGMKFQFRDGRRRKRMAYGHQTHILQSDTSADTAVCSSRSRVFSAGHRERPHF